MPVKIPVIQYIFKSYLKVLCIETSTSLGSMQKFDGAAGEFKGALGSRLQLISSSVTLKSDYKLIF